MNPKMVGISPSGIADMTSGLERNLKAAVQVTTTLRAAFAQAQVPTDTIDSIYRTLGIMQDELPMLKRRHSLALQIDSDGEKPFDGTGKLPKGMVAQGAGNITFTSDDQAGRAGKADAKAIEDALDRAKGPDAIRPLLQRIKANSGDSVYADAFVDVLGPRGVGRLAEFGLGAEHEGNDKDAELGYSSLGSVLATASHHIADPAKWLDSVGDARGYPTRAIAPLLKYGDYDPAFLEKVGEAEFKMAVMVHDPERSKQVWDALANNPRAASLLYQLDMPGVAGYTDEKRPLVTGERQTIAEFAKLARAATVGVRKLDPHEADASVYALLNYYNSHPSFHSYDQLRNVYADLIKDRWNDLVYSISTPMDALTAQDDPTRSGVEIPPTFWKNILTDAMRHGPAAAEVLNKERSWANGQDEKIYEKIMHTQDGVEPDKWERTTIAEMNALFTLSGAAALAQLKQKDQRLADNWLKNVTLALGEVKKNNVDLGAYFKDGIGVMEAKGSTELEKYSKSLMQKYFGDSDVRDVADLVKVRDYRKLWQQHASDAWDAAAVSNAGRLPAVKYDGKLWHGDPILYEKKYNTKFTYVGSDKRLHIMDPDQLGAGTKEHGYLDGWQQMHAYNEWLKDPAVVRMISRGSGGDVSDHFEGN